MLEARTPAVAPSLEGLCRLCARRKGDICVFSQRHGDTSLSQQALMVASLKIVPEDSLPHVVCHACAERLSRCYLFRQRAWHAQRLLRARAVRRIEGAPGSDHDWPDSDNRCSPSPVGDYELSADEGEPSPERTAELRGQDCAGSTLAGADDGCGDTNINDNNKLYTNATSKDKLDNGGICCSEEEKKTDIGFLERLLRRRHSKNNKSCSESAHKKGKSYSESAHQNGKSCSKSTHKQGKCYCSESTHKKSKSCSEIAHKKGKSCFESSYKQGKCCSESAHKKGKISFDGTHKKDKSCSESVHKKGKSCCESSHRKGKNCSLLSKNEKRKLNKSYLSESNYKKSKLKGLNSKDKCDPKLNKNIADSNETNDTSDTAKEFVEKDVKSDTTDPASNLFDRLQNQDADEVRVEECKIEKNTSGALPTEGALDCKGEGVGRDHKTCIDIDESDIKDALCYKGIGINCLARERDKDNDYGNGNEDSNIDIGDNDICGQEESHEDELNRNGEEDEARAIFGKTGVSDATGDRDSNAASWCESDEEKLLHTALRLSIVRHSQDWEIKRETDASYDTEVSIDVSVSALNAAAGNATQLKLKVRDDLYADSPGAPISADPVPEDEEVAEMKKSFQCQLCSEVFDAKSLLKRHLSACCLVSGEGKGEGKEQEQGENKRVDRSAGVMRHRSAGAVQKKDKVKRKKERKCKGTHVRRVRQNLQAAHRAAAAHEHALRPQAVQLPAVSQDLHARGARPCAHAHTQQCQALRVRDVRALLHQVVGPAAPPPRALGRARLSVSAVPQGLQALRRCGQPPAQPYGAASLQVRAVQQVLHQPLQPPEAPQEQLLLEEGPGARGGQEASAPSDC